MINNAVVLNTPVRNIKGKVELYQGSILLDTYKYNDNLKSFSVARIGEEGKFFGFGICQKATMHLVDKPREISLSALDSFKLYLTANTEANYINPYPLFNVNEVSRNENTNELTIIMYDGLYGAAKHTVSELPGKFFGAGIGDTATYSESTEIAYTIAEFAEACAYLLNIEGIKIIGVGEEETCFDTFYNGGANFDGTETIRAALNAIAEVTQTIYYLDSENYLVFKRLDIGGDADLNISRADYFTLQSSECRVLTEICSATELGDNVSSSIDTYNDITQYVRDNPFWSLRDDIATLLDNAIAAVGGLAITQHICAWRGNYLLEIGDKILIETKDNQLVCSYLLNDTVTYNGSLSENTSWAYAEPTTETASNPSSLGEALKQTFATVDKIKKEISLVSSETTANSSALAALKVNTDSISSTVQAIETKVNSESATMQDEIETIKKQVETKVTAEEVTIQVHKELENGVDKVTTHTGFTFDDEGMTVSKSDSELSTQITENGMTIYSNNTEVLKVRNYGVDAANLHAVTYLLIGENSRFEDYIKDGEPRTACFFVGG